MFPTSICRTLLARSMSARLMAFAFTLTGCEVLGAESADEPDQPVAMDSAVSCSTTDADVPTGSGIIAGSGDGTPFTSVATALWLGAPDSDATTVVHLFAGPVACAELCAAGWDQRIRTGTQILELKMLGKSPAAFPVVQTPTP